MGTGNVYCLASVRRCRTTTTARAPLLSPVLLQSGFTWRPLDVPMAHRDVIVVAVSRAVSALSRFPVTWLHESLALRRTLRELAHLGL